MIEEAQPPEKVPILLSFAVAHIVTDAMCASLLLFNFFMAATCSAAVSEYNHKISY